MSRRAVYGIEELSWEEFRKIFLDKYVSMTYRDSVAEYARKFEAYSRYAPEYVSTEADRIWKFRSGLKMRIRSLILSAGGKTYQEVVELALGQEQLELESNRTREAQKGRHVSTQGRSQNTSGGGSQVSGHSGSFAPSNYSGKKRKFYKRNPQGQSQQQSSGTVGTQTSRVKGGCFKCGQKGHMINNCPNMKCRGCGQMGHTDRVCPEGNSGNQGVPAQPP
ncbi:hypothetical protein JQN44_27200, partial [Klebsiella pneumoniae]|uniref:hypothetical protein n=1 Tax=Klebsiella pneumoniae TaxID=573 RepID=UPI00193928D7